MKKNNKPSKVLLMRKKNTRLEDPTLEQIDVYLSVAKDKLIEMQEKINDLEK